MNIRSALKRFVADIVSFDHSQISYWRGVRNTIGIVAPLSVGIAVGRTFSGITMSVGALIIAFSDLPGPYRLRASRMALATGWGALSVFIGSVIGTADWLVVVLSALWGIGGGMLAALGPASMQIGLSGILLLLIYSAYPASAGDALIQGGLVLCGGGLQALLSVGAWPIRPVGPERLAVANMFRQLAEYARDPSDVEAAPPATDVTSAASTTLMGIGRSPGRGADTFRVLLHEAERIRLQLVTLDHLRGQLGSGTLDLLHDLSRAAGDVLDVLAEKILEGRYAGTETDHASLLRFEEATRSLRTSSRLAAAPEAQGIEARTIAHVTSLGGHLRACLDILDEERGGGETTQAGLGSTLPAKLQPGNSVATLRANLSLGSASFRHALRLGAGLAVAGIVAHVFVLPRPYWVPLTTAIVLRPDFNSTFTRGIARIGGTMLGLGIATLLVFTVFGTTAGQLVLVTVLLLTIRTLGAANFGLVAIGITALMVLLLSFAGASPETTIVDRGIDTLVGGLIALLAYVLWPTWERTQIRPILAGLLDAYRLYFDAVMTGYLRPNMLDRSRLNETRLAARLARSNVETSIERLRSEPVTHWDILDEAEEVLAHSHRFTRSAMVLEAGISRFSRNQASDAARRFSDDVDATLLALSDTVRNPTMYMKMLPDLRRDIDEIARLDGGPDAHAIPIPEIRRIGDSLDAIVEVVRRRNATAPSS